MWVDEKVSFSFKFFFICFTVLLLYSMVRLMEVVGLIVFPYWPFHVPTILGYGHAMSLNFVNQEDDCHFIILFTSINNFSLL